MKAASKRTTTPRMQGRDLRDLNGQRCIGLWFRSWPRLYTLKAGTACDQTHASPSVCRLAWTARCYSRFWMLTVIVESDAAPLTILYLLGRQLRARAGRTAAVASWPCRV